MTLEALETGCNATVTHVDWANIAVEDGKRLRALGLDEGARVSIAHRGVFGGRDPLAIRLGRMTVALRKVHAAAVSVTLD